ncbi:MAG: BadF/BadG/BcrA/BcrD ATPase family protein [Candidatus Sulfotelmatobacter sp.]
MAYYLGIDGGGSKTTCAVGDETSILATVQTGPSNITRVGKAGARESLHQAIREGCDAANIDPAQVHRACVGAAGAGREEAAQAIRKIVAEVIVEEIAVVGDMPIALEAAFGEGPGVIVIAGTGSFAYGRDSQRKTARAGGWGFAVSDEGSAHWIGLRAVREALRAADESATLPPLLEQLMRVRGERSFDEFLRAVNSNTDFATFFPLVVSLAEAGDSTACQLLTEAGGELANLAGIVTGKLFADHIANDDSQVPLAIAGGVFRHARIVRETFYDDVRSLNHKFALNKEIVEPVHGALQMARRGRG